MDLRLLIIATDPLARAGLASLLADQPGCTVVGQFSGESDLLLELNVYRPDVLLWDLGWDPTGSLEQLANLPELEPPTIILLPDEDQAIDAWGTGAQGILLRDATAEQLLAAVQAVSQGLNILHPILSDTLLANTPAALPALAEALTPRESEVLQLLAEGLPNKAIARRLDISEHTVKFHVNAIMGKLNAQSRTEAVVRATQLGLILL